MRKIKQYDWHCCEEEKKISYFPTFVKLGVGSGSASKWKVGSGSQSDADRQHWKKTEQLLSSAADQDLLDSYPDLGLLLIPDPVQISCFHEQNYKHLKCRKCFINSNKKVKNSIYSETGMKALSSCRKCPLQNLDFN
jgi:hypothetical protein